jgi:hypothetical protein
MRRNIFLTFDEWSALKEEVNPGDEYWQFELHNNELKKWMDNIEKGYGEPRCFERVGVCNYILSKIKTPYLYNRLLQENYRSQDLNMHFMFVSDRDSDERNQINLNHFISWATACISDIDMNTTKEQWIEYNKAFKAVLDNDDRKQFWAYELVELFSDVTLSEVSTVA